MISPIDLDHVAVALERHTDAWPRYAGELGGAWAGGGGTAGFWSGQVTFSNGMKVEVLEPHQVELNDFLRRFLDRNGPGPHHLTFKVGDIQAALAKTEAAGYRPVGVDLSHPWWKEAFIHPKDAPGIVVQLAESPSGDDDSGGDWARARPEWMPAPAAPPASLVHVAHAVARLEDGTRLFVDLLGGEARGEGEDGGQGVRWLDLGWKGPGRVRLLAPTDPAGPLAAWLGDRTGRLHHLAFAGDGLPTAADARALGPGIAEVPPEANFGVRLHLAATAASFATPTLRGT